MNGVLLLTLNEHTGHVPDCGFSVSLKSFSRIPHHFRILPQKISPKKNQKFLPQIRKMCYTMFMTTQTLAAVQTNLVPPRYTLV